MCSIPIASKTGKCSNMKMNRFISLSHFFPSLILESWGIRKILLWLLLLATLFGMSIFLKQHVILTTAVMWNTYSETVSKDFFNDFYVDNPVNKWVSVLYILIYPIQSFLSSLLVAAVLLAGGLMMSYDLKYADYWRISFTAELVFALGHLLNMLCIVLFVDVQTMEDFNSFHEFSLKLLSPIDSFLVSYPFRLLNVFELAYIVLLVGGFMIRTNSTLRQGIRLVARSYIPALCVWAGLVGLIGYQFVT